MAKPQKKIRIVKLDNRNLILERVKVNKETGEKSWTTLGYYYPRLSQAAEDQLKLIAEDAISKYAEDGEIVTPALIKEAVNSIIEATVEHIKEFKGRGIITEEEKPPTAKKRGRPKKNV